MELLSIKLNKKHIFWFLATLVLFGGAIRLMAAYNEVHYFDLPYYFKWSSEVVENGIFSAYHNLFQIGTNELDYPPLFLFLLYITGWMMKIPGVAEFAPYSMLVIKMWQILFDLGTILLIYAVLRKQNKLLALGGAALWAVNPAILFNSSYWGQTDSMMIFFLLLAFYLLERNRPLMATFLFALACLCKFQCIYFLPVFVMLVLYEYKLLTVLKAAAVGIGTGIAVFLPFMFYSGITLPFQVYLGGLGKYPYASLYAYNLFSAMGLNYVNDSVKILPFLTANQFGSLMTLLAMAAVVLIVLTAKKRCPYLICALLMNTIFMFGSRMHERYQIPVILFLLMAAFRNRSLKLFICSALTTLMVCANQFFTFEKILAGNNPPAWAVDYQPFLAVMSVLNILLYFVTLAVGLSILYHRNLTPRWLRRWMSEFARKEETHVTSPTE